MAIKGKDIQEVNTRKSMYDQDCVVCYDNEGDPFMMHVDTILLIARKFNFETLKK